MKKYDRGLVWFRRDLRVSDQAALYHALKSCKQVWCAFVFDTDILDALPRFDRRVEFIHASLLDLDGELRGLGQAHGQVPSGLIVRHASAQKAIPKLAEELRVQAVFCNHDDEPHALARDAQVRGALAHAGVMLHDFKDHTVFERSEVLTQSGTAFSVFTPFKNAWLKKIEPFFLHSYPVEKYAAALAPCPARCIW